MPSSELRPQEQYFRIGIRGKHGETPQLLEVCNFLYDFNMLYEVCRLATDQKYGGFIFSSHLYYRNGRPLRDEDRLSVESIRLESPVEIQTLLLGGTGAVAAIWCVVQAVEKIAMLPLNRRKLMAEVEKLERENKKSKPDEASPDIAVTRAISSIGRRNATQFYEGLEKRLKESAIQILEFTIEVIKKM